MRATFFTSPLAVMALKQIQVPLLRNPKPHRPPSAILTILLFASEDWAASRFILTHYPILFTGP
jgi:hypothetical protein